MNLLQNFMQDPVNLGIENLNSTMLEPLAFASKTFTSTEQCYANIEPEMLAIVYGLEKFQYYMFGRHNLVLSDHKPLALITGKDISIDSPRLQQMLLKLQHFSFKIHYRKGNNIVLTDHLSRNVIDGPKSNEMAPSLTQVHYYLL